MNQYIKTCIAAALIMAAAACNRDEVFEREQFKNQFALVCEDEQYSTMRVVHDLREFESIGYISASLGGSRVCDEDIVIDLVEDPAVLLSYNQVQYEDNVALYEKPLPAGMYTFDTYRMTIPAGKTKASLPVRIRPEGLSPDSVRYIGLRVDSYTAGELNLERASILYELRIKNWWSAYSGTNYESRMIRDLETGATPGNFFVTKTLHPLGASKVRVLSGVENQYNASSYAQYAMTVDISDSEKTATIAGKIVTISPVTITSFGDLIVLPVQENDPAWDPEYPNCAYVDNNGFTPGSFAYRTYKTIRLHYRIVTNPDEPDPTRLITEKYKEEIRLEFVEDPKDPRFLN